MLISAWVLLPCHKSDKQFPNNIESTQNKLDITKLTTCVHAATTQLFHEKKMVISTVAFGSNKPLAKIGARLV
jgi:hypothetical protein